ncbi:MAG: hypothetical protein Q8P40_07015 [Nitrospirota bacterium]|nr:hypothetical protein [Nitrospirota bacterium]
MSHEVKTVVEEHVINMGVPESTGRHILDAIAVAEEYLIIPMPGDLVMILNSGDCLVKNRSLGVIEGIVGEYRNHYLVCFNDSTFNNGKIVNASGGPAYCIDSSRLKRSPRIINKTFWKWKDFPRAGGGEYYLKSCKVWILNKGGSKRAGKPL